MCVVGGGLAGLTAAREIQAGGRSVVLLEAKACAWGASGRNGGFVLAGYALPHRDIVNRVGFNHAGELYTLSMGGVAYVRRTIRELDVKAAEPAAGILRVVRHRGERALQAYQTMMAEVFARALDYWPRETVGEHLLTDRYYAGLFDPDGFHCHPLVYARALAAEVERLGGRIFEDSAVLELESAGGRTHLRTAQGRVDASDIVLCCGGHTGRIEKRLAAAILPVSTHIIVTGRLGEALRDAVRTRAGVLDDRRASDYYRIVDGDRLLWGGRITARNGTPRRLADTLKSDLLKVYPQLRDVTVESAWSGVMGYARHMMPQIGLLRPGLWYCTAFGGHGMNTTAVGGRLIASAILEGDDRYRLFEPFGLTWTGGSLGRPTAQLVYWADQLGDSVREWRARWS